MGKSAEDLDAAQKQRRDVPIGVVMVAMSVAVWWPSFTLGAYGEIFFDQLMAIWAAATAAFVFVLVERRPVGGRLVRAFLLLLPSLWLLLMFTLNDEEQDFFVIIVDLGAILAVLIGLPFTLWVLVRIVWPDFAHNTRGADRWLITVVVLGIAMASFMLGLAQDRFLTCEDFVISGNTAPTDCTPAPPD
ncbi:MULTISPECIES: hypothetical protein [Microbacterium]|uniref:Uncharacterized protein n=1 Tax=Microbacterium marmarense TaxID=3122051 RepID=A0ABU8LPB1_9MICO